MAVAATQTRFMLRRSTVAGRVPTNLLTGELGINLPDQQLYFGAVDSSSIALPNMAAIVDMRAHLATLDTSVAAAATQVGLNALSTSMNTTMSANAATDAANLTATNAALLAQDVRQNVPRASIGAVGWLNTFIGAGYEATNQLVSLSTHGCAAAVFGTRSSDQAIANTESGYAFGSFALNNNTTQLQTVYGGYIEATKYPGAGATLGLEIDVTSTGPNVTVSPYLMIPNGLTPGLWLQAFQSRIPGVPAGNPSCAIGILSIGCKWSSGIVFSSGSVASGVDGFALPIAMDMPETYAIVWRNHIDAQPVFNIRSDCTQLAATAGGGGAIIATNTGITFQSQNGVAQIILDNTGLHTGRLQVQANLSLAAIHIAATDAAAATAGVGIDEVYALADGTLRIRLV